MIGQPASSTRHNLALTSPFMGTRAEISLPTVQANVRALRQVAGNSSFMAVVKAEGYGHGAAPVGRAALAAGASWLGVYTVGEGLALRSEGIDAPILIFGPFESTQADTIVKHRLTPTITTVEAAEALQRAAGTQSIPYHLKIDTGLSRAGVSVADVPSLARKLSTFPALSPEGIYTHFASADASDTSTTYRQLAIFNEVVSRLADEGLDFSIRHASNTAGMLNIPEARLDLVRCGIGIYGYHPGPSHSATTLEPALRLCSSVSRAFTVPAGTGIGYGHDYITSSDTRVAVVPIGYGDGLPRALGNGNGCVLIRGNGAPIIGRVSMDQITVDVSKLEGVMMGERVTIIGHDGEIVQNADDLARQAGTISYEILSRIMPRVPRLYSAAAS